MEKTDFQKVMKDIKPICDSLSDLCEFVQYRDKSLHRHLIIAWSNLIAVYWSGLKFLDEKPAVKLSYDPSKPVCPDRRNCKNWIEAFASDPCVNCDFRPY